MTLEFQLDSLFSDWWPLDARSILGDPRKLEMRDAINAAVKYRDPWRPFAASMVAETAGEFFERRCDAPPEPFPVD